MSSPPTGATLQLIAREIHVDPARTTLANAALALDTLATNELAQPELRRLTDAFGGGAQWAALVTLPHADLADSIGGYDAIFRALADAFHQQMGWRHTIITIAWPYRPPPAPRTSYLTMVYDYPQELPPCLPSPT